MVVMGTILVLEGDKAVSLGTGCGGGSGSSGGAGSTASTSLRFYPVEQSALLPNIRGSGTHADFRSGDIVPWDALLTPTTPLTPEETRDASPYIT